MIPLIHVNEPRDVGVVFLYHPHTYETDPSAQLGLGLLAIATHLAQKRVDVRVLNAQAVSIEEACAMVPRADVLALYGCLVDAPILNAIARALRGVRVIRVVVGGPIAKSPDALDLEYFDHVVDGEGEDVMEDLVRGVRLPKLVSVRGLRRNINDYPFPRRDFVEGPLGGRIFHQKAHAAAVQASSTILTSRGCRYRCAFCMSGSARPPRPVQPGAEACAVLDYTRDRIEAEVEHCLSLGIRALRVSDDNIINDPDRLAWLCELMRRHGIVWRGSIRVRPASRDMYALMASSGCQELSFGIESGDQAVLNKLRKGVVVEWNTEAVQLAKQGGIGVVRALMMMCTPGETARTAALNRAWVEAARPDVVSLKVFVPYPGTAIHTNPERFGVRIVGARDHNNSSYRPDGSVPESHIEIIDGMSKEQLTRQFLEMRDWLDAQGVANHG